MLHLSRYPSNPLAKDDILTDKIKDRQPHHLSGLATKDHRQVGSFGRQSHNSLNNQSNKSSTAESSLAIGILRYQLNDHATQKKHLANLRSNLEHRLQVAESMGNQKLINVLKREFKQLT